MNDTLSIKPILPAQIGSTQLGTAIDFSRNVTNNPGVYSRVNTAKGLLNPTSLLIGHYPKSKKQPIQRSYIAVTQRLTRVDANGAVLATLDPSVKVIVDLPEGVTSAEIQEAWNLLAGTLCAGSNAVFGQLCEMQR